MTEIDSGVQEQITDKLVEMKVTGHEKMQATDNIQINSPRLQHQRGEKHQKVDDKQIFGDSRYVAKHLDNLRF
jgi:hypothetical protein